MIFANVTSASQLMGKIAMKKWWEACYDLRVEARKAKIDTAQVIDAPIPLVDDENMTKKWIDLHNVVLPDSHLLIANHQGKLWRDFGLETPQVSVWLAETIRQGPA